MTKQANTKRVQSNYRMSPYTEAQMFPDGYTLANDDYAKATLLVAEMNAGKLVYSELRRKFIDEFGFELPALDTEVVDLAFVPLSPWRIQKDGWSGEEVKYIECTRFVLVVVK